MFCMMLVLISDPLEEIVGLDTSYHGGLMLGAEDTINPEYVSAFNKRREENVRRRSVKNPNISNTVLEEFDHEEEHYSSERYDNSREVATDKEEDDKENVSVEL